MNSYDSQSSFILVDSQESDRLISKTEFSSRSPRRFWNLDWLWNKLFEIASHSEPRIIQKRDRYGNTYFQAYDPLTGHSGCFHTEYELRVWIERRYYQ
jgi:hypothetical protein